MKLGITERGTTCDVLDSVLGFEHSITHYLGIEKMTMFCKGTIALMIAQRMLRLNTIAMRLCNNNQIYPHET